MSISGHKGVRTDTVGRRARGGQMEQREQPSPEAGRDTFGELSSLTDVDEVASAIVGLMSNLFSDYEPGDEGGRRVVFEFGASLLRGGSGDAEMDEILREKYLSFDDRPRAEWHAEADFDAIAA